MESTNKNNNELFILRQAVDADRELIDQYTYLEGMDKIPSLENVMVAANDADQCVGFLRIAFSDEGVAHVNPVIVYKTWQKFGVGRALVQDALFRYKELRLVARGSSIPFYKKLGFLETAWENIDLSVTEDCAHCPMKEECGPLPMKLTWEEHT